VLAQLRFILDIFSFSSQHGCSRKRREYP
jgi:hypothetical protein